MLVVRKVRYYLDPFTGTEPARVWLEKLDDKLGRAKIMVQIVRAQEGNFGKYRFLGEGVNELKINFGPGYRVYFAVEGDDVILQLIIGDKSSQEIDIAKAKRYWKMHRKEF